MPDHYRFGGGASESTLNPIVLVLMLLAGIAILVLPRRQVIVPFLLIALLIPAEQTLVIGGLHLFVVRVAILFGLLRMLIERLTKGSPAKSNFNSIDKWLLCWALVRAVAAIALYADTAVAINQCAFLLDSLGGYFFLRFSIQNERNIVTATKTLAIVAMIAAIGMVAEQRTGTNMFGLIGGHYFTSIREGKLRSQGPFSHAILAGVFGATIAPLFIRLWSIGRNKMLAVSGFVAASVMVIASSSSTPFGAYLAGILSFFLWPLRAHMSWVRWGIVLVIAALAMVMKAPVWFLLAHIDLTGGSSSYHRAMLLDTCIRKFSQWWLFGTHDNQNWGWDMWDIQNQFVAESLRGGLMALIAIVMILSRSFSRVGTIRRMAEKDGHRAWIVWALGCILFSHVVAFVGADYYDQTRFWWYTSLAMVSASTMPTLRKKAAVTDAESSTHLEMPAIPHELICQ